MKGDVLPILSLHHTKSGPLASQHTLAVKLEYALGMWGGSWCTRRSLLLLMVQPLLLLLLLLLLVG